MVLPPERRRGRREQVDEQPVAELDTGAGAGEKDVAEPGDATWADGDKVELPVGDAGRRRG